MKPFLAALALVSSLHAQPMVQPQPRGGVQAQPRDTPIDIGSVTLPPAYTRKAEMSREGDYEPLDCGAVDQLGHYELSVIESPSYPYRYPNNGNCSWTFAIPDNTNVWTWCETFAMRRGDYFHLDGQRWYGFADEYGFLFPTIEVAEGRDVMMGFSSNRRRRANGFRCWIYSEPTEWVPTTAAPTTAAPVANTTAATGGTTGGSCTCGIPNRSNRIVGGQETEVNEYPWQVGLVSANGKQPWCGGTLISDRHVLTAAHCTAGSNADSIAVIVGEHRTDDWDYQRISLSKITDDPDYNSQTLANDFSILTLSEPVTISRSVAPACMPWDTTQLYAGQLATVSGWGTLTSGGNQPTVLHEVDVTVQTNAVCQQAYGSSITDVNICAADSGKDSCQGDSGGPMVIEENGRYAVIGVVSWGYGCAFDGYPGVYARVTARKDWILANTEGTQESTCGLAG